MTCSHAKVQGQRSVPPKIERKEMDGQMEAIALPPLQMRLIKRTRSQAVAEGPREHAVS